MKKQLLFLLAIIFSINCYSQISFTKGYFVDNADQKIACLIKNIDWLNNPSEFKYKLTDVSETQTATIKTAKEFGIDGEYKYTRHKVNIDQSTKYLVNEIPNTKEGEYFLKVLVEGKASLYSYKGIGAKEKYYYKLGHAFIEQLIYQTPQKNIRESNRFKQQLWADLKCPKFSMDKIKNLDYKKNILVHFFMEYNECTGNEFVHFEEKQKKGLFKVGIRPGLNYSSLSIERNNTVFHDFDFGTRQRLRLGIEAEFVLPFNKNKWATILEPTYQHFKTKQKLTNLSFVGNSVRDHDIEATYSSIEVTIGLRHYFYLSKNSKVFVNGLLIVDFGIDATIDFEDSNTLSIAPIPCPSCQDEEPELGLRPLNDFENTPLNILLPSFGVGYTQNDKYSLELRYLPSREIIKNWAHSKYSTISVIVGFLIFKQ